MMRSLMFVTALGASVFVVTSAFADPAATPPPLPTPDATAPPPVASPTGARPAGEAPARPEPAGGEERTANNAVYLEGLGPGLIYSVNYERSFSDFAARIGFGYISVSAGASSGTQTTQASASILTIPLTLSYLGIGSKQNIFELGAGATILHAGAGASTIDTSSSTTASGSATVVLPHVVIGYRFMPPGGGFLFRAGISAIVAGDPVILPWPYVALGGVF